MASSYRIPVLLAVVLKVMSLVLLVFVLIGAVGVFVGSKDIAVGQRASMVAQMVFQGLLMFLTFFALGEMLRILAAIEQKLGKE